MDIRDRRIPGLLLRVSPGGTRTYYVWYRIGRSARRLKLGRSDIMGLAEARQLAKAALKLVAQGYDPAAEKQRSRIDYEARLFPTIVESFVANHAKRKNKDWRETERLLLREFSSRWSKLRLDEITRHDIYAVLDGIVLRGSPGSANHALAAVRKLFNWSVERGYIERSPCDGIKPPAKLNSRDRVLTDDELVRVWIGAEQMGFPYGRILQLLFLTGLRLGEVSGLRWGEVNLSQRSLTLPAARNKSGRDHVLPLTDLLAEFLGGLPRRHPDLIFPARGSDRPASGHSKWKQVIDCRSGVLSWRQHDIRRTVSSGMARLGIHPHVIERIQNRRTGSLGGVAGIYNRYGYLPEMREALEIWGSHVMKLIEQAKASDSTVTPLLSDIIDTQIAPRM